jgi:hypothetical protein
MSYEKSYDYFLNFGLSPSSPCLLTTTFRGMALPSFSGAPTLVGPVGGASLYRWTQNAKHTGHAFQLCVVVYKQEDDGESQNLKNSNTAPSSKTFRDEVV